MNLKIDYKGSKQGFALKMDLDANIEQDAESLGYITVVLFEAANRLAELMKKTNPKYHRRLAIGVASSKEEKQKEGSNIYPFTTFLVQDE